MVIVENIIGKHTYQNSAHKLMPSSSPYSIIESGIRLIAPEYSISALPKPAHSEPTGKLAEAIKRDFGSFENFKKEFNAAAVGLFGSGWAWLSADKNGKLHITKEANGSNPVRAGLVPLLGFDVWEHAYYLDYQNRRADHVNELWSIIDWDVVGKRLK